MLLCAVFLCGMGFQTISEVDNAEYLPDTVIIMLNQDATLDLADFPELQLQSLECLSPNDTRLIYKLTLRENVLPAIEKLKQRPDIKYAIPDLVIYREQPIPGFMPFGTVDHDIPRPQWHLDNANIRDAWDITTGSPTIRVGVMDSGIYVNHPDLAGRVDLAAGRNFYPYYDYAPHHDFTGHGTHVAAIIGANGYREGGVKGVDWNCRLVDLIVFSRNDRGHLSGILAAIKHAAELPEEEKLHIMNFSVNTWDLTDHPEMREMLFEQVSAYSGLFVVSAGNHSRNTDHFDNYPANLTTRLDNVIMVGASNEIDGRAHFSNFGPNTVDLLAPGDSIMSALPSHHNYYWAWSGTSMAAPVVAGAAALMMSIDPDLTPGDIKKILTGTVNRGTFIDLSSFSRSGGLLDVHTALRVVQGETIQIQSPEIVLLPGSSLIEWTPVAGALGYHVYANGVRATNEHIRENRYNLGFLNLPLGYSNIQVRAIRNSDYIHDSELSNLVTYRVSTTISDPTISLNQNGHHINLPFISLATGFHIYINGVRRTTEPIENGGLVDLRTFNLDFGSYNIQVRAINTATYIMNSGLSNLVVFTVGTTLATPFISVAPNGVTTWEAIQNASGYHIYVDGVRRTTTPIGGTTFNLATLTLPLGVHEIQVRAIHPSIYIADSALSTPACFTNQMTLFAPLGLTLTGSTVGWNSVTNADGYHIYAGAIRKTTTLVTVTEFNLATLDLDFGIHDIQVRATNNSPYILDSGLSNWVRWTKTTTLIAPTGVSVTPAGVVTWDTVIHATGYHLYVGGIRRTSAPLSETTFSFMTLLPDFGTHNIQVRAINPSSFVTDSGLSSVATFTRSATLTRPMMVAVNANGVASWASVTNATGFGVYVGGVQRGITATTAFDLNTISPPLAPGNHSVQIRATNPSFFVTNSELSTAVTFTVRTPDPVDPVDPIDPYDPYDPNPKPEPEPEPDNDDSFPWLMLGVVLGNNLLWGGCVFVFFMRKHRNQRIR